LELWPHPNYNRAAESAKDTKPEGRAQGEGDGEEDDWEDLRPFPDPPRPRFSGNPEDGAGPSRP